MHFIFHFLAASADPKEDGFNFSTIFIFDQSKNFEANSDHNLFFQKFEPSHQEPAVDYNNSKARLETVERSQDAIQNYYCRICQCNV